MRIQIVVILVFAPIFISAQSKFGQNWTIGYDVSDIEPGGDVILLNFNNEPVDIKTVKTVDGFFGFGALSTMSDADGNLIFYTSGCYVVNAAHEVMENGDSINPGFIQQNICQDGNSNNLGGAISIPWPDSPNQYLLFVNDYQKIYFPGDPDGQGCAMNLYFNVIDMKKNNGLGAVVLKNQVALTDTMPRNSIEACLHANGRDWWVLTPEARTNCYHLTLITPLGIAFSKVVCSGKKWSKMDESGQALFTPDGKKFVRFNRDNGIHIYGFDNELGDLFGDLHIPVDDFDTGTAMGVSVSPNSRYLYVSAIDKLFQYDLEAQDVAGSRILLMTTDFFLDPFYPSIFTLSGLGPDGKIYVAGGSSHQSLHVIHRPDCAGLSSLPERRGISLTSWNYYGMPNMPHFRNEVSTYPCDSFVVHTYTPIDGRESIVVFPNPAVDQVTIRMNHPLPKGTWWILHDQLGREVKRVLLDSDEVELSVSLEDYLPGIFYFSVISDTRLIQRGKLILLR